MKIRLTTSLLLLVFLTISMPQVHARSLPEISKKKVSQMIDYIHEQYQDDYTSFGYSPSADFNNHNAHAFNGIFMHFIPYYLFSNAFRDSKNQMKPLSEIVLLPFGTRSMRKIEIRNPVIQ